MSAKLGLSAKMYRTIAAVITNSVLTSNVVTITTQAAHGFTVGQLVKVACVTHTALNGTFVIASTPTGTTFTYALTHADVTTSADSGPATEYYEITNAKDVSLGLDKGEADVSTRAGAGWKQTFDSLKDASIEFDMIWDTSDVSLVALSNAFFGNTMISMAIMDGPYNISTSQGLECPMTIVKFERKEPLAEAMMVSVSVRPGYGTAPVWTTIP